MGTDGFVALEIDMGIWLFKRREHQVIRVQFVDAANETNFAPRDLPIDRLPASFEAHTTMHVGTHEWEVVEARPMTAAEFGRSGTLVLVLRKVTRVKLSSLDELLYSLPTIANELPSINDGSSKLGKSTLGLYEDDWRQIEWLGSSLSGKIETEFAAIREIYAHHRASSGFKKTHVRQGVPEPMQGTKVTFDALASAAGARATILDGVSWQGAAGITANSFVIRLLSSIEIYGLMQGGYIEVAAFHNTRVNNLPTQDVQALAAFAAQHGLVLVDWCKAMMVVADEARYQDYFTQAAASA